MANGEEEHYVSDVSSKQKKSFNFNFYIDPDSKSNATIINTLHHKGRESKPCLVKRLAKLYCQMSDKQNQRFLDH